jgi:hypothetical protein
MMVEPSDFLMRKEMTPERLLELRRMATDMMSATDDIIMSKDLCRALGKLLLELTDG